MGRVTINERTVETRLFPGGRKQSPEWMECKKWEVERKKELLKTAKSPQTLTGCALLLAWGEQYLAHAEKKHEQVNICGKTHCYALIFGVLP